MYMNQYLSHSIHAYSVYSTVQYDVHASLDYTKPCHAGYH